MVSVTLSKQIGSGTLGLSYCFKIMKSVYTADEQHQILLTQRSNQMNVPSVILH